MQFGANLRERNGLLPLLLPPFRFLRSFGNKSRIYLLLLSFPPFPLPPPPLYIAERKYSRGRGGGGLSRQGGKEKRSLPSTCYFTTPYGTILDFPPKFAEKTNEEEFFVFFANVREIRLISPPPFCAKCDLQLLKGDMKKATTKLLKGQFRDGPGKHTRNRHNILLLRTKPQNFLLLYPVYLNAHWVHVCKL